MNNPRPWMIDLPPGGIVRQNVDRRTGACGEVHAALPFWLYWAQIARHHADQAARFRMSDDDLDRVAEAVRTANSRWCPPGLVPTGVDQSNATHTVDEIHRSMIAVSASAHAIDGFYGTASPLIDVPTTGVCEACGARKTPGRARVIGETLKRGFKLGAMSQAWQPELDWLFRTRDKCVHHAERVEPVAVYRSTERNDVYGAVEFGYVSAVAAERAVTLAIEVMMMCLANPKPRTKVWADERAYLVGNLRALINQPTGEPKS